MEKKNGTPYWSLQPEVEYGAFALTCDTKNGEYRTSAI
jgi:hypothetical protein